MRDAFRTREGGSGSAALSCEDLKKILKSDASTSNCYADEDLDHFVRFCAIKLSVHAIFCSGEFDGYKRGRGNKLG